ncbi:unnamed protein product [Pleuronectes platessa]|uniref:Uncharacterized protein n=1 Tax=Pleuronectes platessa TaxID=8262 RepID=A0A9N7TJL5_PLEPL|nr:unnamed protein product [Pleuronectes platessa]
MDVYPLSCPITDSFALAAETIPDPAGEKKTAGAIQDVEVYCEESVDPPHAPQKPFKRTIVLETLFTQNDSQLDGEEEEEAGRGRGRKRGGGGGGGGAKTVKKEMEKSLKFRRRTGMDGGMESQATKVPQKPRPQLQTQRHLSRNRPNRSGNLISSAEFEEPPAACQAELSRPGPGQRPAERPGAKLEREGAMEEEEEEEEEEEALSIQSQQRRSQDGQSTGATAAAAAAAAAAASVQGGTHDADGLLPHAECAKSPRLDGNPGLLVRGSHYSNQAVAAERPGAAVEVMRMPLCSSPLPNSAIPSDPPPTSSHCCPVVNTDVGQL